MDQEKLEAQHPNDANAVHRHLSLFDLVSVGVGGTIGSGVFVLTGFIAHHYAGPATSISFLISGVAACCSGMCYAELAGRIPASGSTYAYAYIALGELPAVLSAACLTLEYAVSGAAVARSWGDKVVIWLRDEIGWSSADRFLDPGFGLNPMAFCVSAACVALLMDGVKESKTVTNIFTTLKVALVIFMIVGGFWLLDGSNLRPFAPYGATGVLRGATSSFFGYLGYDEVCCIAGEALNPHRDMPRAVICTLCTVTILYFLAALALAGMQPCDEMSDTSAFPEAFRHNNVEWAAQLSAAGEVITLPVVTLISLMAQPRLQLALAQDGLLPPVFGKVSASGNLRMGAMIAGSVMIVIATFVPFEYLDDLISAGILIVFSLTNWCLIRMRCEPPRHHPRLLGYGMMVYNILCFTTGLLLSHTDSVAGTVGAILSALATACTAGLLAWKCPRSKVFGGGSMIPPGETSSSTVEDTSYFRAPGVPLLPCMGIFVNWYLISELNIFGILLLLGYLGLATVGYFCYGAKHSIGNTRGWTHVEYEGVSSSEVDHHDHDEHEIELSHAPSGVPPSSAEHDESVKEESSHDNKDAPTEPKIV